MGTPRNRLANERQITTAKLILTLRNPRQALRRNAHPGQALAVLAVTVIG